MVDLIIVDLYGTIVKTDGRLPIRDGFEEFSQFYREQGVKIVLFTDGPEESTIRFLLLVLCKIVRILQIHL